MADPKSFDELISEANRPMRSRRNSQYQRFDSVDAEDILVQRETGWPDFHPEDFCHRCGYPNVSWYIDSVAWNRVMREGNPAGWGRWQEIICIPCFIELAQVHYSDWTWQIKRDETGTEVLIPVLDGNG